MTGQMFLGPYSDYRIVVRAEKFEFGVFRNHCNSDFRYSLKRREPGNKAEEKSKQKRGNWGVHFEQVPIEKPILSVVHSGGIS